MTMVMYLLPVALCFGALGLATFLWTLKSGQYDDLEGAAHRILDDGDDINESSNRNESKR